jgi:hypothetical protein
MIVGQKVVCINGQFDPCIAKFYVALPVEGVVYVIRNVVMGVNPKDPTGEHGCEVCLYLVGLNNPRSSMPPFPERGFNAERFRPLEEIAGHEQETDAEGVGREAVCV